jgi:hypothetical protein
MLLNNSIEKAKEDLENARLFYNNLPSNADQELYDCAFLNLQSAEKFLNYKLRQTKNNC